MLKSTFSVWMIHWEWTGFTEELKSLLLQNDMDNDMVNLKKGYDLYFSLTIIK